MSHLGKILSLFTMTIVVFFGGTGVASATAPVHNQVTASVVSQPFSAPAAMVAKCQTKSYDYNKWDWTTSRWHVLNKCRSIYLYNHTKGASSSTFDDLMCSGLTVLGGPAGWVLGPLCLAAFRVDGHEPRANMKYVVTHNGKCLGLLWKYYPRPFDRTSVQSCRYH